MQVSADTTQSGVPPIFGTSARTEILTMLMSHGATHVREIARQRGVDSASTFRSVERLISSGLAVKRNTPGGRKYVNIDRSHYAFRALRRLLEGLAETHPIPGHRTANRRLYMPKDWDPHPPFDPLKMFGSRERSAALLLMAAAKEIDLRQMSHLMSRPHNTVWHVANALEREELAVSRYVGARRVMALNPALPCYRDLQSFLRRLIDGDPRYRYKAKTLPYITRRWR